MSASRCRRERRSSGGRASPVAFASTTAAIARSIRSNSSAESERFRSGSDGALSAAATASPSGPSSPALAVLTLGVLNSPAARGEGVEFVLTVRNDGGSPLNLRSQNGCGPDFAVSSSGTILWRYLDTVVCPQGSLNYVIGPGRSRSFEGGWNQTTAAGQSAGVGTYGVHGTIWTSNNEPLDSPVTSFIVF